MRSIVTQTIAIVLLAGYVLTAGCADEAQVLYVRTAEDRPELAVQFVIDGNLNNEQVGPTVERLKALMGTNLCSVTKVNTPKRTIVTITPIRDVEDYVGRIDFASVESIDPRRYRLVLLSSQSRSDLIP